MADAFFDRFSQQVQAMAPAVAEEQAGQTMAEPVAVAAAASAPPSALSIWG